ncbi:MAG: Hpt domain-containing protein [Arthrobacter sp.]
MTATETDALPLLDSEVLEKLRAELEDDAGVWKVFVTNFVEHLPHRTQKVRQTLTTGDLMGSLAAVLSLKTSSQMVGAERLAGIALELERSIRQDASRTDPDEVLPRLAAAHLRLIEQCCHQTTYLLRDYIHPKIAEPKTGRK